MFDGRRIAKRGKRLATGEPAWLPLVAGYNVVDEAYPERIAVFVGGKRVH